jgi:hypothetical protein
MDPATYGKMIEGFAKQLDNQTYRFVLLFFAAIGFVLFFINSQNLLISILIVTLSFMMLLFSLLASPNIRPDGWNPAWTFYLFLSFVGLAIIVLGLAYYYLSLTAVRDKSANYESDWQKNYQKEFTRYALRVTSGESEKAPEDAMRDVISKINHDDNIKNFIIRAAGMLEQYLDCNLECRDEVYRKAFDERIFTFWANFRCYIASLRGKYGFPSNYGHKLMEVYENNPEVLMARNALKIKGDSLRVCPTSI